MAMPPFNLPWSTFGAFVVLAVTLLLAVVWALWDRRREISGDPEGGRKGGAS
jgi:hypothetical protein